MKTLITIIISLAIGTTLLHAQGLVTINARPNPAGVLTNTSSLYAEGVGPFVTGPTFSQSVGGVSYYYALLIASATTAGDVSPVVGSDWVQATVNGTTPVIGTNFSTVAGAITGNGGVGGTPIQGWAAGATMNIMMAGWSANYGNSWAAVQALFGNGTLAQDDLGLPGYFGWSNIGNIASGGAGSPPGPSVSVFSTGGITEFSLYSTTPEPATLALAALGGLSLLLFRRGGLLPLQRFNSLTFQRGRHLLCVLVVKGWRGVRQRDRLLSQAPCLSNIMPK